MSLKGKVALVTGASSGIGRAIALELGRQGASVVVNYRSSREPALEVAEEIERSGSKALVVQADVSKAGDVERMFQEAAGHFGRIDVLVNNAGIEIQKPFLEVTEEEWDRVIDADLKGPFLCTQAAARLMRDTRGGGTVINISSIHEDLPFPGYASYCAAKGGLRMLCRDLALELAPYDINVVNVGPGAVGTPINQKTLTDPEKKAALEALIPLKRIARPEEVARLVAYLASDDAKYITGTTVFIDGGLMWQASSL